MSKKLSFFLGQGGSGGDGGFAIIKISYPIGQQVQVTFQGNTIDAPDTTGSWLFGCEEAGTYTISIVGTTITKNVSITTKGQIESVYISPQVINYTMLYYMGTTNEELLGTLGIYSNYNSWSEASKREGVSACVYSSKILDTRGYDNLAIWLKGSPIYYDPSVDCPDGIYDELNLVAGKSAKNDVGLFDDIFYNSGKILMNNNSFFITTSITKENTKNFGVGIKFILTHMGGTNHQSSLTITNTGIRYYHKGQLGSPSDLYIKCFMFYKTGDDISGLSAYGSTISEILANSYDLFLNTSALNYMVQNCTGDFLVAALNDTNFRNQMNNSANKTIIMANEHWAKFIALLA